MSRMTTIHGRAIDGLLTAVAVLALAGCTAAGASPGASGGPSASLDASTAPSASAAPSAGGSRSSPAVPAPTKGSAMPSPSPLPSDFPLPSGAGQVPASVILPVLADASARTSVPPEEITIREAKLVTWPDGGLGCPEPGMVYPQVLVDGAQVVVVAGSRVIDYRIGGDRMRICL